MYVTYIGFIVSNIWPKLSNIPIFLSGCTIDVALLIHDFKKKTKHKKYIDFAGNQWKITKSIVAKQTRHFIFFFFERSIRLISIRHCIFCWVYKYIHVYITYQHCSYGQQKTVTMHWQCDCTLNLWRYEVSTLGLCIP